MVITGQGSSSLESVPQILLPAHVEQRSAKYLATGKSKHSIRLCILFLTLFRYEPVEEANTNVGTAAGVEEGTE